LKNAVKILLGIIIAVFVIVVLSVSGIYYLNKPVDNEPEERYFSVPKGSSLGEVADDLQKKNYIRSSLLFEGISKVKGTENAIKSGFFQIPPGKSTFEIHSILIEGKEVLRKITIPEGLTIKKLSSYLQEKGFADAETFLKTAHDPEIIKYAGLNSTTIEGLLYPDTYHLPLNYSEEKLITHMIDTFYETVAEIYPDYKKLTKEELYQKIILASIIEREYRVSEEAPLISSVFMNRIADGMYLGSCATIEYIITEVQGKPHPRFLTYEDLEIESEYNTYTNIGLPPSPISNPGKTALEAAFYPAETSYRYFLLQDQEKGTHYFSENYDEHSRAKILYLKGS